METFLQRVLLCAMCITQFMGSVEAFVLSTHTRVRCASGGDAVNGGACRLSAHTRVRCASLLRITHLGAHDLSAHTRVRCASTLEVLQRGVRTSQLIPAYGVRRKTHALKRSGTTSQLIPAFGVRHDLNGDMLYQQYLSAHTRVRCASAKATKMSCVHGIHMHNFYLIECIRKR